MSGYRLLDTVLDRSVVLGFSEVGLAVRSRLPGWPADPTPGALVDREVAVTGATSGLGLATALGLARLGARVHLVVRDEAKGRAVADRIGDATQVHRCDVGDLDDVRRLAEGFPVALDVMVHNAGVMPPERSTSAQGHELSMAVHVLGPVLMSELLPAARTLLVTSGGMYAQALRADDPEYLDGDYSPTTAYARSKRAQVALLPVLDRRWSGGVWATHPGWADTPGVAESLPGFRRVAGRIFRDADGGADTTVWLSATEPAPPSGGLWHDRAERTTVMRPGTRSSRNEVEQMWHWVSEQTGITS